MEINWVEVWTQTSVPAVPLLGAFKSQLGDTSYCVFCCCFIALPSDNQTSTWGLLVDTVIAFCQYWWFVLTLFRVCSQLGPVHTENSFWLSFESGHHLAPVRFYWSVFARTMHSTSEFAKMFLSKCVLYSTIYIYIYIYWEQTIAKQPRWSPGSSWPSAPWSSCSWLVPSNCQAFQAQKLHHVDSLWMKMHVKLC